MTNLYGPSQSFPSVKENSKVNAESRLKVQCQSGPGNVEVAEVHEYAIRRRRGTPQKINIQNRFKKHIQFLIKVRNQTSQGLPCKGTFILMEYIGVQRLPRSFFAMIRGSPPHIIG